MFDSRDWMPERELPCVQAESSIWPPAPRNIAEDRMADRCAVNAKLVRPARDGFELEERRVGLSLYDSEPRSRMLPVFFHVPSFFFGVTSDRPLDQAVVLNDHTVNEREILFLDLLLLKLSRKLTMYRDRLSDNDESGCFFIEAVDETGSDEGGTACVSWWSNVDDLQS